MRAPLHWEDSDAVLFDLDGVLTDTARVHATCWKRLFDAFLAARGERPGEDVAPFDLRADYDHHVDGKPRLDGARDFLVSRGIQLPEGLPSDSPEAETVQGLAKRKDAFFEAALESVPIEAYAGSRAWLAQVRAAGIRTGVVSSSHHCAEVLEVVGLAEGFGARVDGVVIDELGLAGKPAPDAFLEAARRLGVEPGRSVVVEDALSGVAAGRAGHFGLVIGVARKGNAEALQGHGADRVVEDLAELLR